MPRVSAARTQSKRRPLGGPKHAQGLAEWFGIRSFPKELATSKELVGGGILLEFCESPGECET